MAANSINHGLFVAFFLSWNPYFKQLVVRQRGVDFVMDAFAQAVLAYQHNRLKFHTMGFGA